MVFVAKSIFALFCEKLIKKPCLLIVQNQFHGMFARFDADIAVISAVFAVQSPGNLLVGLDDDAVGLERIDEVCVILLHQQGRNDLIQFQRVFGRLIRVTSKSPSSRRTSCPGRF